MKPFHCMTRDGIPIIGGVFFAADRTRGPVVLAHGLPAGRPPTEGSRDEGYPGLARRIAGYGFDVAIFNFRGTGPSGGHLEIDLWPNDLSSVLDGLEAMGLGPAFTVVGFSAGGAAAITQSARDGRIARLVTMAAPADYSFLEADSDPRKWFEHYRDLGMIREGYAGKPEEWAARFRNVRPRESIGRSKAGEIFLFHGGADEVVPVAHAEVLAAASDGKARKVILPGVAHQTRRDERAVRALIRCLLGEEPPAKPCGERAGKKGTA